MGRRSVQARGDRLVTEAIFGLIGIVLGAAGAYAIGALDWRREEGLVTRLEVARTRGLVWYPDHTYGALNLHLGLLKVRLRALGLRPELIDRFVDVAVECWRDCLVSVGRSGGNPEFIGISSELLRRLDSAMSEVDNALASRAAPFRLHKRPRNG